MEKSIKYTIHKSKEYKRICQKLEKENFKIVENRSQPFHSLIYDNKQKKIKVLVNDNKRDLCIVTGEVNIAMEGDSYIYTLVPTTQINSRLERVLDNYIKSTKQLPNIDLLVENQ